MPFFKPNVGKLKASENIQGLIDALPNNDDDVRAGAAMALGELGDARAVEPLIAALADEANQVRRCAAESLGELGDSRAVEPLIAALGDNQGVVMGAAEALGKLGDARAVEPLLAALRDHTLLGVWREAGRALAKLGYTGAVPLMLDRWDAGSDGECDLCNASISPENSLRVFSGDFRHAVLMCGYNPITRERLSEVEVQLLAGGGSIDPEAASESWRQAVLLSETDWALCLDCARDLATFLTE